MIITERDLQLVRNLAKQGHAKTVDGMPVDKWLLLHERKPSYLWPLRQSESVKFGVRRT